MSGKGKKGKRPGLWLRLVVAGLVAAAALAAATSADGNARDGTVGGPAGCVVIRVAP
jgi:hypothetical protein